MEKITTLEDYIRIIRERKLSQLLDGKKQKRAPKYRSPLKS